MKIATKILALLAIVLMIAVFLSPLYGVKGLAIGGSWTMPDFTPMDKFWAGILQKIRTYPQGTLIQADARKTTQIPVRAITETSQYDVVLEVTFISAFSGKTQTVILNRNTVKNIELGVLYYPWKEFEKVYCSPEENIEKIPVLPGSIYSPDNYLSSSSASQKPGSSSAEASSSLSLDSSSLPTSDLPSTSASESNPTQPTGGNDVNQDAHPLTVEMAVGVGGILSVVILLIGYLGSIWKRNVY